MYAVHVNQVEDITTYIILHEYTSIPVSVKRVFLEPTSHGPPLPVQSLESTLATLATVSSSLLASAIKCCRWVILSVILRGYMRCLSFKAWLALPSVKSSMFICFVSNDRVLLLLIAEQCSAVHMCHIYSIQPSGLGPLGWFHILAVANNVMNMDKCLSACFPSLWRTTKEWDYWVMWEFYL